MTETADDRRTKIAEFATAIGLLVWRLVVLPFPGLLCDWVSILALYWIFTVFAHRSKSWPWVTAGAMVLLTGIYLQGQLSHTLEILGIRL